MFRWLWLLLMLVVSTAGAGRLTSFEWDWMPDWPPGTTVELCGNGDVCLNGLTGTQATLDLPVNPGEVILGRARAVAPAGYQCGDPPAPCPYSEWATVAQTWPLPAIGGWARYEQQEHPMAIEYLGYSVITDSDGSISQSVTVPNNTNYAVIFYAGWTSFANDVSSISLGGTAATNLYTRANSDDYQDSYVYGVATSSGDKTFALTMSGVMLEGGIAILVYLSGVNTSDVLEDSDYYEAANTAAPNKTVNLDTTAGGIGLVFGTAYNSSFDFDVQSQTSIVESSSAYNNDHYGAGYKTTAGGSATFGSFQSDGGQYSTIVAVTLNADTAAASFIPPSNSSRLSHLLVR